MGHELDKLKAVYPQLVVESVEVMLEPKRTWRDGIRGFPALKIGDDVLTGFILTPGDIRSFIEKHLNAPIRSGG